MSTVLTDISEEEDSYSVSRALYLIYFSQVTARVTWQIQNFAVIKATKRKLRFCSIFLADFAQNSLQNR